jgi:transposase-like protein
MERRKFTREFKLEAVRLIKERGVSYMNSPKAAPAQRSGALSRSKRTALKHRHNGRR